MIRSASDAHSDDEIPRHTPRAPAVAVAVAFAAGIAIDRTGGLAWAAWILVGGGVWCGWMAAFRYKNDRAAALLLLAACLALGGARHHLFWSIRPENDIARYGSDESTLARIEGVLAAQPWIKPADPEGMGPGGLQADRSIALVACDTLESDFGAIPVEGLVRVSVSGHLLHARVGDRVDVRGWLSKPPEPANPGEFDFRDHLRRQGVGATLFVDHPDAVRMIAAGDDFPVRRWFARLRARCGDTLARTMSPQRLPVAEALLLGDRAGMTDEIRRAFAQSGMMHLLAISGLHVGILAAFFWFGCRMLRLSESPACLAVIALVVGYALLTEGRPPVVRATIFVVVYAAGRPWFRQGSMSNTLAIAAIAVLAWNPADLFDVGAQLSFLAVAGMLWCGTWWKDATSKEPDPGKPPADERWRLAMHWGRRLGRGYALIAAIWLFTLPWVASRFNLIAPAGFVLNGLLMPVIALVLWAGYTTLLVGLAFPELALVPGVAFDFMLGRLLWAVDAASSWTLGHRYGPGPPGWWLVGYYGLLAGIVALRARRFAIPPDCIGILRHGRLRGGTLLGAWAVAGMALPFWPAPRDEFRCTFLSVGHGCAVLLEFPNGRTLLYDAGSLEDGRRAAQAVQGALWRSGRSAIDTLVVSHADIDHFNAAPHLLARVPVGRILIARSFLDLTQPAVARFQRTVEERGIPVRLVRTGDRLLADDDVAIRVLHPPPGPGFPEDNANSIVLEVETAGRRILLTGDLEGPGLDLLIRSLAGPVDVLLAPHHGGIKANVPRLAEWAAPRWVIVSGNRRAPVERLRATYGGKTTILSTAQAGAIACRIDGAGNLGVSPTRRVAVAASGNASRPAGEWRSSKVERETTR
ncbi:MAG: ComEC/Rec2 family competence protein [Planctomycetaceae bacterium]